jgi:hypothetical protein
MAWNVECVGNAENALGMAENCNWIERMALSDNFSSTITVDV